MKRKGRVLVSILCAVVFFAVSVVCMAQEKTAPAKQETKQEGKTEIKAEEKPAEKKVEIPRRVKHRFEFLYMWEFLHPEAEYGKPWRSMYLHYYGFPSDTFNYFLHFGTVYRDGKNDYIGIIGSARDWTPWFYTYADIAMGTISEYMPKFRYDLDLNFKFLKKKNLVWTVGINSIKYHLAGYDIVISSGLSLHLPKWVFEYRLFQNHSNPGNIVSYTHLGSIGFGAEKKCWTYATFSKGSLAYLAMYVTTPEEVRQSAINYSAIHRQWISKNLGFWVELDFVKLKEVYDKFGIFVGAFWEL